MGAQTLGSRAIIGRYHMALEQDAGTSWIDAVSMLFTSDQDGEEYRWLGQSPTMREWVGGRHAKGFTENGISIPNKHFEATLEILVKELRRDKTDQIMLRIDELAQRTNAHWAKLISDLIISAESTACYDGQYFFDTDHTEGDSGTQSNDIEVDISALPIPADEVGTPTLPGVAAMQQAILKGVTQIMRLKDDQGEPMNESAKKFLVMVPPDLAHVALNAQSVIRGTDINEQMGVGYDIRVVQNVRLDAWTDQFVVFRADGSTAPFIRQQEAGPRLSAKAEGSEYEFDHDAHQYGVDTWRNVGLGYWQKACLVKLV